MSDLHAWKQQAHALFEYEAKHYASLRERESGFRAQLSILLRMLDGECGRILDIGCAAGSEISALRGMGFRVVGVDFSTAMLRYALQRFAGDPDVQVCQCDAEFLPFRSGSFDHVICLGMLEYLPNYRPALGEVSRLLRPGGLAVFSIPSAISPYHLTNRISDRTLGPPWRLLKRLAMKNAPPPSNKSLRHSTNRCIPWKFRRLLREFGLVPKQSAFSNFFVYLLDRLSPASHDRLAGFLERFSSSRLIGWTASQYMVSARRS